MQKNVTRQDTSLLDFSSSNTKLRALRRPTAAVTSNVA
jgi:hypothetical protein